MDAFSTCDHFLGGEGQGDYAWEGMSLKHVYWIETKDRLSMVSFAFFVCSQ